MSNATNLSMNLTSTLTNTDNALIGLFIMLGVALVVIFIIMYRKKKKDNEVPDTLPPLELPEEHQPEVPKPMLESAFFEEDFDIIIKKKLKECNEELKYIEGEVERLQKDYVKAKEQKYKMEKYLATR